MCVILQIPKNVRPNIETLRLCERANPHGGGIAWRNGGNVEWIKTNDVNEIDKLARRIKGELVIHFRIASVGGVSDQLRHPFPCTHKASTASRGRSSSVLFQNGTWLGYAEALRFAESEGHALPDGEMSDARAAAFLVSIYGHRFLERCGGSRWVYMNHAETVRFGDWFKRDGIYFSNLYWLPPAPPANRQRDLFPPTCPTKRTESRRELYSLTGVDDYWSKLTQHSKAVNERACQCCEGSGRIEIHDRKRVCPVCHGTKVQPQETEVPEHAYLD